MNWRKWWGDLLYRLDMPFARRFPRLTARNEFEERRQRRDKELQAVLRNTRK